MGNLDKINKQHIDVLKTKLVDWSYNTLEILCTELNAVPHAGLGFHFLRVPVRTIGAWGVWKRK